MIGPMQHLPSLYDGDVALAPNIADRGAIKRHRGNLP